MCGKKARATNVKRARFRNVKTLRNTLHIPEGYERAHPPDAREQLHHIDPPTLSTKCRVKRDKIAPHDFTSGRTVINRDTNRVYPQKHACRA